MERLLPLCAVICLIGLFLMAIRTQMRDTLFADKMFKVGAVTTLVGLGGMVLTLLTAIIFL